VAEPENVVELEVIEGAAEGGDAPVRLRRPERGRYCSHRFATIDEDARRVYCRNCDVEIDPVTFLISLAHGIDRYRIAKQRAKQDAERAERELRRLKREIVNARSRLRTAERRAETRGA
jgi:hypothetical protein